MRSNVLRGFHSAGRWLLAAALALAIAPAVSIQPARAAVDGETLLLQDPTISAEHIVFTYARDLWIVGRDGGEARRLTSSSGDETNPRLSPDGKWVAFTGQYEGNTDVYVLPVEGGMPKRLTWHPGSDVVRSWHPDGKRVVFISMRDAGAPAYRPWMVSVDGGMPESMPIPKGIHVQFDAAGERVAFTPIRDAFRSWKRYRGGRTGPVWVMNMASLDVEEVPHVRATDTFPCWVGADVYFASDRDGQMNMYRFTPGGKDIEQVTRFTDYGVRNMTSGDGVVAFTMGGAIHTYDPANGKTNRLRIQVRDDGLFARPAWQTAGSIRSAHLSPNGKRAVFESRGEIITVPKANGDPRNLSKSPGAHDRNPIWSPDGTQVACLSDRDGEYKLWVSDRLAREEAKAYDLGGARFYYSPQWSPDGKHVLFKDKGNRIGFVTLKSGDVTTVSETQGSLGVFNPGVDWSPDSKWIAFEMRNPRTTYDRIAVYELKTKKVTPVTDVFGQAFGPAFSKDGKHLYFAASINMGPKRFGLDMSASASRRHIENLYIVVLKKDGKHPMAPSSDEGGSAKKKPAKKDDKKKDDKKKDGDKKDGDKPADDKKPDDKKDDDKKPSDKKDDDKKDDDKKDGDKKDGDDDADKGDKDADDKKDGDSAKKPEKKPAKPSIDLEGIQQRVLALPKARGDFRNLKCSKDGLLVVDNVQGSGLTLKSYDLKGKKLNTTKAGVSSFQVSYDGKYVLYRAGSSWNLSDSKVKSAKRVSPGGMRVRTEPQKEWPQILREAWRIQRDYFYDPNMHGVDWDAMWDRWSVFLPHVRHRADLNTLIAEMIGELCCGHEYVSGGQVPRAPSGVATGLLGCDWEIADGKYRVAKIYRGQNWNPGLRSPLTEPGADVNEGDYLISVDGVPADATGNIYHAFQNTSGRQLEIEVSKNADGTEARKSTIIPLSSESQLRRLAWVEDCRRRVDELSGGRLAYAYMPNTGGAGMAAFDRDFYSQVDKEGLILDERYNGGGKIADYVIDILAREPICYWMNREGWTGRTPFATMTGPKVMIINESAGSGGDAMPWMFRQLKIGPLVGTRTWGGLVGISGYPALMDGGSVTSASFGIMDTNGEWVVENEGVTPDHIVVEYPKDIMAGRDPQLEKAVKLAMEALERSKPEALPGYKPPKTR